MVKKKIIFFLPSLSGGGIEKNLIVLLNGLVKKNKFIEVFPNTIINVNSDIRLSQQIHYLINKKKQGYIIWEVQI